MFQNYLGYILCAIHFHIPHYLQLYPCLAKQWELNSATLYTSFNKELVAVLG